MTDNQIDAEMMGECWHEFDEYEIGDYHSSTAAIRSRYCVHCKKVEWRCMNPDFSLWPDKGRLLDWLMDDSKHPQFGFAEFCGFVRSQRQKWHFTEAQLLAETFRYLLQDLDKLAAEWAKEKAK